MNLEKEYTTKEKIDKDTEDEEIKKTELSSDAYAICEFVEHLVNKIEHIRISIR